VRARIYRLCGIDPAAQMSWKQYALCLLLFNALGALALYALQRWQAWLPLNPQKFAGVSPGSSFNTAVSFHHQHHWQGYPGGRMSYLTQMAGLTVQTPVGGQRHGGGDRLIRGLARHSCRGLSATCGGHDARVLYILLPLACCSRCCWCRRA